MSTPQETPDKLTQTRNLYFETTLTQAQIAEVVGISQKTVSAYINENQWKLLKERAAQSPTLYLEQMNSELREINHQISSRPRGHRFPTREEAEIRRKIMVSIASMKERMSAGQHSEVLTNFITYVYRINMNDAKVIVKYADKYLKGEMKFGSSDADFITYPLPGEIEPTLNNPTDTTPGPTGNIPKAA